ncbi:hypothetical protein [Parasphingopyxis lamellibrachiae]|uniref:Uncharacterized protein n=1 Tax=Parasphingopyxis lamellibrachiae TaxID=680125 RepID=A0A3D9FB77_9SPHN|nr:hypothetical protein [Parasphingopyxis lamellibrachiae]RED15079.1 hypothetical protein DFR46_0064 [Parasphingopyxis lamellibrachiae]
MTPDYVKKIFLIDAAACALTFGSGVFATQMIATDTGLSPFIVAEAGWICLGAALLWGWLGTRAHPPLRICWLAIALNIGWIAASIGVLELNYASLTTHGQLLVPLQTVGVIILVTLEIIGVRQMSRQRLSAA